MPAPHPVPTAQQRRHLDALYELVVERDRIATAVRAAVTDCADAGLSPTQIGRYTGISKETARQVITRHAKSTTGRTQTK